MGNALQDPLAHNSWATRQLLAFCRDLSPEQLRATSTGNYGTILETLQHLLGAEGRYLPRLTGSPPDWQSEPEETEDLDELVRMAEDLAPRWEELASGEFDSDRVVTWVSRMTGENNEARAGMLVAQVLNHGNEHRAQIFTILTTIGVEPPNLDAWQYGLATGRYRELPG